MIVKDIITILHFFIVITKFDANLFNITSGRIKLNLDANNLSLALEKWGINSKHSTLGPR